MKNLKINLLTLSLIALTLPTSSYADSLKEQMDNAFGSLSNTTTPKAYDTARRGVLTGGQVFVKVPTKRVNVFSATAPRISAGCGGIDLYGGSFSYINADQLIQTFQAIGTNALGYGVKLAIASACPTCEQIMTSLEKTAQAINKLNLDSCQAAQGLVNATIEQATTQSADSAIKNEGVEKGIFTDLNNAWTWANDESSSATNQVTNTDASAKELINANIAWKAFKENNIQTAFGGDDKFLEMLMTMTGTAIISNPSTEPDSDPKLITYAGGNISLKDLIEGGDSNIIKTWKCDTDSASGCLGMTSELSQEFTDEGLKSRIYSAFTSSTGLINAYRSNSEWSDEAKSVLGYRTVTADLCRAKIYNGVNHNADDVQLNGIATICASRMAVEVAYAQVDQYINTAISMVESSTFPEGLTQAKASAVKIFKDSRRAYKAEYEVLDSQVNFLVVKAVLDSIDFSDGQSKTLQGN
jgi:conjugative transfer pilus assembly protein TraH